MWEAVRDHSRVLDGTFQSHHGLRLADVCFGPNEVGVRRLRALLMDLPQSSPAGRALGMWTDDDEREALAVEVAADAATTLRVIASLWMDKGKSYDAEPALRWEHPNRPVTGEEEPEMTHESIHAAISAAIPRR